MTTPNIPARVHIGEVVRNAVLFNPENSRERAVNSDMLIETVSRFFALLRERENEHVARRRHSIAAIRRRSKHG